MAWYNNFMWFSCDEEESPQLSIYCASPGCRRQIKANDISYDPAQREFTHVGQCQLNNVVFKVMVSGQPMSGNFDILSRKQALNLVKKGKVSPRSLDDTLD